jgi:hypothetical protein
MDFSCFEQLLLHYILKPTNLFTTKPHLTSALLLHYVDVNGLAAVRQAYKFFKARSSVVVLIKVFQTLIIGSFITLYSRF